jgi:phosphate starvation-inducible protein PhoH
VLTDIPDLAFVHLDATDVVRHRIVADIVAAYESITNARINSDTSWKKRDG